MTEPLKGKKILWVEDDSFLGDIIIRKLTQYDCKLFMARNADEAMELFNKENPDVILLDVVLPGKSGFDLLQDIRATAHGRDLPVVFLSNTGLDGDVIKAEQLGAKKFLIKAVSTLDQIIAEIRKALS